jgi:hypothetical protein
MGVLMKKKQNWKSILNSSILERSNRLFEYGRHDCCMAIFEIIEEMTGKKICHLLGEYSTEEEAEAIFKKLGGAFGMIKVIDSSIDLKKIPINFATGGDICVVKSDPTKILGIVALNGRDVFSSKEPKGWGVTPLNEAVAAYRIE